MKMEVTNEILAAYAEGKVSIEERNQVREYLTKHPSKLESVVAMMDEDYELELCDADEFFSVGKSAASGKVQSFSDIALSAAAFTPISMNCQCPRPNMKKTGSSVRKSSFAERMNTLLNELDL